MNNIFVGNLSFQATKEDLIKLFEPFGSVANAVIMERKKGKSRGYGFVDMPNEEEKNTAIAALAGKEFMWRVLSVSVVIPKVKSEPKPREFKPAKKEWTPSENKPTFEKTGESKPFRKGDQGSKAWVKSQSATKSLRGDFKPSKPWLKNESNARPQRKEEREAKPAVSSESASKYYSKLDGPPKPWQKSNTGAKPFRKDDRTFRPSVSKSPYKKFDGRSRPSGKPEGESKFSANKLKGGFKMSHKVSGIPKALPKKV